MTTHPTGPAGPGPGRLPQLAEVIRDAEALGVEMMTVLHRDYDRESAPQGEWPPGLPIAEWLAAALESCRTDVTALSAFRTGNVVDLPTFHASRSDDV